MTRKPVTVSLPLDLIRETNRFCHQRTLTVSELTREALRDYLYRQSLEAARHDFTIHVNRLGILSEDALVKKVTVSSRERRS